MLAWMKQKLESRLPGEISIISDMQISDMEKVMAPHSSTLAWKIPRTEEPGRLQSMGSLRVGHNWVTSLSFFLSCIGEGNGNPLQCSCLENPRDGGAWWAAVYGVTQSRTRLKWLSGRYADDTTLMTESEEELKCLLMKVKEESEKVGLKLNIQKTKIMASGSNISWQIYGKTVETVIDFISLGSKITAEGDWGYEIKRHLLLGRKVWPTCC